MGPQWLRLTCEKDSLRHAFTVRARLDINWWQRVNAFAMVPPEMLVERIREQALQDIGAEPFVTLVDWIRRLKLGLEIRGAQDPEVRRFLESAIGEFDDLADEVAERFEIDRWEEPR